MILQNCAIMFARYYGYYYSIGYLVYILPALILTLIAQGLVNSRYKKYSSIANSRGLTGEMAARMVLSAHGITNVRIEPVSGKLTDHYSPKENVIRLSEDVYSKASVAAVGIAAHEAGHAVQHAEGYTPNKIRTSLVPIAGVSSKLAMPLIIIGLILPLGSGILLRLGIIAYSLAVFVYLITLPVEFDASRRALATIQANYMLDAGEYDGAKKILTAAAMTYVASALTMLLQLLRLIMIASSRRR